MLAEVYGLGGGGSGLKTFGKHLSVRGIGEVQGATSVVCHQPCMHGNVSLVSISKYVLKI